MHAWCKRRGVVPVWQNINNKASGNYIFDYYNVSSFLLCESPAWVLKLRTVMSLIICLTLKTLFIEWVKLASGSHINMLDYFIIKCIHSNHFLQLKLMFFHDVFCYVNRIWMIPKKLSIGYGLQRRSFWKFHLGVSTVTCLN